MLWCLNLVAYKMTDFSQVLFYYLFLKTILNVLNILHNIKKNIFSLQCLMILQKQFEYTNLVLKKHLLLSTLKKIYLINIFVEKTTLIWK